MGRRHARNHPTKCLEGPCLHPRPVTIPIATSISNVSATHKLAIIFIFHHGISLAAGSILGEPWTPSGLYCYLRRGRNISTVLSTFVRCPTDSRRCVRIPSASSAPLPFPRDARWPDTVGNRRPVHPVRFSLFDFRSPRAQRQSPAQPLDEAHRAGSLSFYTFGWGPSSHPKEAVMIDRRPDLASCQLDLSVCATGGQGPGSAFRKRCDCN
jgi:hypothetical protein